MNKDSRKVLFGWGIGLLVFFVVVFLFIGPKGCARQVKSWRASSYGSDWLVVHYAASGKTIACYLLKDKSIGNESQSDGIYFVMEGNNVLHIAGTYSYVQLVDGRVKKMKKALMLDPERMCMGEEYGK